jgi:hypothetical protein
MANIGEEINYPFTLRVIFQFLNYRYLIFAVLIM